jgi:hypothetical protein
VKALRWLYPRAWRVRYGEEFDALLNDEAAHGRGRVRLAADLIRGAGDAWLHRVRGADEPTADAVALRRAIAIAVATSVGLAAVIVVTDVVFPSRSDDDGVSVIVSYLGIAVVLLLVGWLSGPAGSVASVRAGMAAGATIAVLVVVTFVVVDNAFLATVSQQQPKVHGFARSGLQSVRVYVNLTLAVSGIALTALLTGAGAALASVGGELRRRALARAGRS